VAVAPEVTERGPNRDRSDRPGQALAELHERVV